ncbi:hypothetical protein [Draconibacterium halophilum]|uniref:Uncharacterized protein n=1 Tax=Draconibacterium halophilum TaxID=2706887 RepID=A0A6C0RD36_9BACT|nr:hypothetical protein [Draconibacterium halophilum]QIA08260.1 hypothetical protein G0Q07_11280 [Draconibacterium halophilum]
MNFSQFLSGLATLSERVEKKGGHLFFEFSAHVSKISVRYYKSGWKPDADPSFSTEVSKTTDYTPYFIMCDTITDF